MSSAPNLAARRDGRALLAAQLTHAYAQGTALVVLPWIALAQGATGARATLLAALTFVPFLLVAAPAARIGERRRRHLLLAITLGALSVVTALLAVAAGMGLTPGWALVIGALAMGAGRVFTDAALLPALFSLMGRRHMVSSQASLGAAFNIGYFGGPAMALGLLALGGPALPLAVACAGLIIGIGMVFTTTGNIERRTSSASRSNLMAGLRLLVRRPSLRALSLAGTAWGLAAGAVISAALPYLRLSFGAEIPALVLIFALGMGAMLLAPVIIHRAAGPIGDGTILTLALLVLSPALVLLALAPQLWVAALAYALTTGANAIVAALLSGARAARAPDYLQSATGLAGRTLVMSATAAGGLIASGGLGPEFAFLLGAVLSVVAAVVALKVPAARHPGDGIVLIRLMRVRQRGLQARITGSDRRARARARR
jgi:hypothetical protein